MPSYDGSTCASIRDVGTTDSGAGDLSWDFGQDPMLAPPGLAAALARPPSPQRPPMPAANLNGSSRTGLTAMQLRELGVHKAKKYPDVKKILDQLSLQGKFEKPHILNNNKFRLTVECNTIRGLYKNFCKRHNLDDQGQKYIPQHALKMIRDRYYLDPPTLTLRNVENPEVQHLHRICAGVSAYVGLELDSELVHLDFHVHCYLC